MKRFFCIAAWIIFGSVHVTGQTVSFETGLAFSTVETFGVSSWTQIQMKKMHLGYYAKANIQYLQKKRFELNTSLGFLASGARGEKTIQTYTEYGGSVHQARSTVYFVSLTTTARYKIPLFENNFIYIGAGPRLDYFAGYNENFDYFHYYTHENPAIIYGPPSEAVNKVQYGAVFETGYAYKSKNLQMSIGFTFNKNDPSHKLMELSQTEEETNLGYPREEWIALTYATLGFRIGYTLGQK
jgi:hypothetical protein